jgi:hypothetical protein
MVITKTVPSSCYRKLRGAEELNERTATNSCNAPIESAACQLVEHTAIPGDSHFSDNPQ